MPMTDEEYAVLLKQYPTYEYDLKLALASVKFAGDHHRIPKPGDSAGIEATIARFRQVEQ